MSNKIVYILLFLSLSANINAQHRKLQNLPYADRRIFHLGFTLGLHTQDLILSHSGFMNENGEVWFSEIPEYSPGIAVGLIGDMYINDYLNLRFVPTLYLGDKLFMFKEHISGDEFSLRIRSNYISIPVYLKLSARRTDNFRPYILMGGYNNLELARKKNLAVLLKQNDFGIEFGIGCDFYLPMFKLAPELKFSFGLIDVLEKDRVDLKDEEVLKYSNSLSKATTRMITLSLNFE
ncbi:MAG: porin family protein [Fermentimonas sp.]|nr:porin family protein [Fermentimonas sp.]